MDEDEIDAWFMALPATRKEQIFGWLGPKGGSPSEVPGQIDLLDLTREQPNHF